MKYKDYKNPHTNDNRIYSYSEIYNMPLGEILRNKDELVAQYRVLGVPQEKELAGSENVIRVEAYTRSDGTEVKAHWRSRGKYGKANPESSKQEGGKSEGGKSDDVQNEPSTPDTKEKQAEQTQETQESNNENKTLEEKLYPPEIAGVKRGEPMTFEEMMHQGVNPNYMGNEDENGDYSKNCQSCTVAAELVIRGYDVEAVPYSTPEAKELGHTGTSAYLEPTTNEVCVPNVIYTNEIDCFDYLEQTVQKGERYELTYNTPTESGNAEYDKSNEYNGHSVLITRNEENKILYYDPQSGDAYLGDDAKKYLSSWFEYEHTAAVPPRILRVDDKALNPKFSNKVVQKRTKK